jgi:hypothetical protein
MNYGKKIVNGLVIGGHMELSPDEIEQFEHGYPITKIAGSASGEFRIVLKIDQVKVVDCRRIALEVGDDVNVPDPKVKYEDAWQHSFAGHIEAIKGTWLVVQDQDGDCWSIEPHRVEKVL